MNNEIVTGLVYNASLLLVLGIIYNTFFVYYERNEIWKSVLVGVTIGVVGILLMLTPVKLIPGIFFDTRSILVSVTAMFFGLIPTAITVSIICIGRIIIGGNGALMGVFVPIFTAAVGLLWNKYRMKYAMTGKRQPILEFYLVGIIVHVVMLLCMFALPHNMIWAVAKQMWLPVLLVYPIGSLLLSTLLFSGLKNDQTRRELIESESKYKDLYHENQNKQTLLTTLIDAVPDLIFYKNIKGIYIGCNSAFEKFAGKEKHELIGLTDAEVFSQDMAELFRTTDTEMINQGEPRGNDEIVTYPDGTEVYLETLKTPYFDAGGNMLGLIGISRDITMRKKKEEEILYLTRHDGLTRLYNRAFFDKESVRLDNEGQFPLSVIIGDINGLKIINDALGHKEGDKLLIEVAKILMASVRPDDIVARIGGDEFGILLPNADSNSVLPIIEKITNTCRHYAGNENRETYYTSISLGYATKHNSDECFSRVMQSAEDFMYRRKLLEYKSLHSSIISSIKTTMYEKSHETEEHTERLSELSKKTGSVLGLCDKELVELELLSMLHDIGKIGVDDAILTKCGSLSEDEWREMKKHPEIGYRIAMASPELNHIAEYILSHHERWDGTGYPQGLAGEDIPILSRILSIVDAYDAMVNDRVYRKSISQEQAKKEILDHAGTQFDPQIAKLFVYKVLDK